MDIDSMEATRELDALVAERVMGFEWWRSSNSGNRSLFPPGYIPRGPHEWFRKRADMTEELCFDFPSHVPHYSTDIAAAWQVVERFPAIAVQRASSQNGLKVGYRCSLPTTKDNPRLAGRPRPTIDGDADTAPLAICKAALKALSINGK